MANQRKGLLLVTCTAVISGIAVFLNSLSVKMIPPAPFTFLKNSIAAIAVVAILIAMRRIKDIIKINRGQWLYLLVIGFVGGCVPFLLFFNGLSMISGSAGSFLHKTMFLFVALLAPLFLKEKNRALVLPAAMIILIGNALLLRADLSTFGAGHLLVIAATILWALENVISKKVLEHMDGTVLAAGRMFFGSVFLLTYLAFTGQLQPVAVMTSEQWLWTAIPAILLVGYVLTWYNGLKNVPVTLAASILLLGAPVTTLLEFAFLQKAVAVPQLLGLLFTAAGAGLIWFLAARSAGSHCTN